MRLTYAIKYVADMDKAVGFYRDTLGLKLRFASPEWTEFETGETTLALHMTRDPAQAGSVEIGLGTEDIDAFHAKAMAAGVQFPRPPKEEHGQKLGQFLDCEGSPVSVSGV